MANQDIFKFPVLNVKEITTLLHKGDKIFSHKITATTDDGGCFHIYENNGIDLTTYVNKKVACLLEITRGEFIDKDDEEELSANTLAFRYQWLKRPYEFFPELVKIKNGLEMDSPEEHLSDESFETTATNFFKEWGLNGLNIGVYQAKPLLSSVNGLFLLNEYQFEEEIEELELDEEVYIKIDELFLRGIRPVNETIKQKQPAK